MENHKTLIQQAEIAEKNSYYKIAENLYYQAFQNSLLNSDLANVYFCLQKILEIFPQNFKANIADDYIMALTNFASESAETEHFQKLQIALQKQANQNVNLQIVMAKILMFQAQNTNNFADEYHKLLQAKNLIQNLDFEYANFQKAQIELYLAQNSQKVSPPPLITIKY